MAQLNMFNLGINTRLAPHLINIAESVVCDNVDITSSTIKAMKNDEDLDIAVNEKIIYFKGQWVSADGDVNYQIMREKLYSSGNGKPQKSSDGVTWQNIGIAAPGVAPTLALSAGNKTGTYSYCYTYYNSVDGAESAPSPYSLESKFVDNNATLTLVGSTDTQVTDIKIYRLGGGYTVMSLVATVTNSASVTYLDNLADLAIPALPLTSQHNGQAPAGLKYITKHNVMLFGAVFDKLYFSGVGEPDNWSPYNFIDYDEIITGLGSTQNGLLVFTEYSTYIVTGTSPETLSNYMLSTSQGCIKHNTIRFVNNTLLWLSRDGVCASSGTSIEVITRPKMGKLNLMTPSYGIVWDDIYFLAHGLGILCIDFRFGISFYTMDTMDPITIDSFCVSGNYLFYSSGGKLYKMFEGKVNRHYTYMTGNLADGSISTLKNYKVVYIHSDEDITVDVIFNNKVVNSYNMIEGLNELKLPQTNLLNYYIAFMFRGIGEVREVEYKVTGRQNGR